jgi:hypothetical protein
MTTQIPEPITPATEAPLTFEAPPPVAPGRPNPIPRGIPWNEPISASKAIEPLPYTIAETS